jgi:hypothetical protein
MEVEVRFNGDDITTSVVSYNMQKKICTGVGSLEIEVVTGGSYDPWDIIEIWEYGIKKGKFFVSKILDTLETGVTTLSCLDNVKRLQDYFIAESYLVDYPSTCKYWIDKFMVEAGVEYEFTVEGSGSLLSNNTSLGVTSAYEQIMILIQMSGWYMYFDDDGIAIIGKLSTEIGDITESYSKSDIIDIKVDQNDNMLRNRVVVWGNQDPITQQWVFADVSHPTPWDYDSNDLRTLLISNSNIPDVANAYSLATIGISEFAKITVEKHLTIAGTCLADLGDIVYVDSDVYSGTGLVTTIGSSMSKEGLITLMILDERCPRLFGFFNFGDYVYIGTLEDGVWRKHLKLLTSWTNYSTGLLNKCISDLHINNGVASLVTVSGDLYQSKLKDNYWTKVNIGNLESYIENIPEDPETAEMITFSGIKGRATILDKTSNKIRYAVDTYSGDNWTDSGELFSGDIIPSGVDRRGWILDKSPNSSAFNNFPISVSGDYNIRVIDLENDGVNDYVSVMGGTGEILISGNSRGYNFGWSSGGPSKTAKTWFPSVMSATSSHYVGRIPVAIFNNESIGEAEYVSYFFTTYEYWPGYWDDAIKLQLISFTDSEHVIISPILETEWHLQPFYMLGAMKTSYDQIVLYGIFWKWPGQSIKRITWNISANTITKEEICSSDSDYGPYWSIDNIAYFTEAGYWYTLNVTTGTIALSSGPPWPIGTYPIINRYGQISAVDFTEDGTPYYVQGGGVIPEDAIMPYCNADTATGNVYWLVRHGDEQDDLKIVCGNREFPYPYLNPNFYPYPFNYPFRYKNGFNCGNIFLFGNNFNSGYYYFIHAVHYGNNKYIGPVTDILSYVLQRTGNDFAIVDTATKPIRLDISTYTPLITVEDKESTFKSFYINKSEAIVLGMDVTLEGMQRDVNDFRYCSFLTSGDYAGKDIVYTNEDDIYRINIDTMTNPTIYSTISGQSVDKIETTNYCPSGQYIFVSTSGGTPLFYQKNPELHSFASYSTNLPDSRITIIRIDDRI